MSAARSAYMIMSLCAPSLPPDSRYARHYCEENIYHLAEWFLKQSFIKDVWDVAIVFISNESKTVALWNQKLGSPEYAIVWDYHVVLILCPRPGHGGGTSDDPEERDIEAWIYDYDTLLPKPCYWKDYVSLTCRTDEEVPPEYRSLFRVIPAAVFLDYFASDRSHMARQHTGMTRFIMRRHLPGLRYEDPRLIDRII